MFIPAINYRPTREIMTKKSDNKNEMRKVMHRPLAVNSNSAPHPNKRGRGPVGEQVIVGAFYDKGQKSVMKYLFGLLGSLLTNQNSVNTVAGWTEWDDFRNEETRTDFIIQTLTTQSKWRQRGRVIHMGWHIPDILLILYNQGYCDSKQILRIVKGFEGATISKMPGWSETTKKLKSPVPDVLHKISVDGPVKFDMEFATFTVSGKERCYIGNAAFGDKPSLMQWFRGKDGKHLVDGKPKWLRYAAHHNAAPEGYTMSPFETERLHREKAKRNMKRAPQKKVEKKSQDEEVDEKLSALLAGGTVTMGN